MDKISKAVAIRQRTLTQPVVVVVNMPTTFYKANNGAFYRPLMECFKNQENVDSGQVHFVPNIVSPLFTIEERAAHLTSKVRRKALEIESSTVHLVAHSFAGVDARVALSLNGLNDQV